MDNETQGTLPGAPSFSSTFTLHGKVKSCASVLVALLATVQSQQCQCQCSYLLLSGNFVQKEFWKNTQSSVQFMNDTDTNIIRHSVAVKCQPRPRPYSRCGPNHTLPTHNKPVLKLQNNSCTHNSAGEIWFGQYRDYHILHTYLYILLLNNGIRSQLNFVSLSHIYYGLKS